MTDMLLDGFLRAVGFAINKRRKRLFGWCVWCRHDYTFSSFVSLLSFFRNFVMYFYLFVYLFLESVIEKKEFFKKGKTIIKVNHFSFLSCISMDILPIFGSILIAQLVCVIFDNTWFDLKDRSYIYIYSFSCFCFFFLSHHLFINVLFLEIVSFPLKIKMIS